MYHLARTWAVVAADSMVEELQVAQVPSHALFQRKANVQYRFVSHLYRYEDGTYGSQ
jgi:hypothetical protein